MVSLSTLHIIPTSPATQFHTLSFSLSLNKQANNNNNSNNNIINQNRTKNEPKLKHKKQRDAAIHT